MRFMSFVKAAENQGTPPQALMDAMGHLIEESMKAGVLIDTGGLAPTAMSTRIRLSGGNLTVVDGPFSEAKELIGGYAVMEFNSKEEAIEEEPGKGASNRRPQLGPKGPRTIRFGPT